MSSSGKQRWQSSVSMKREIEQLRKHCERSRINHDESARLTDVWIQALTVVIVEVEPDWLWVWCESLARLLISNWLGLLEDTVEASQSDVGSLDEYGLPKKVPLLALVEGLDGQVLPSVLLAWQTFLRQGFSRAPLTSLSPWVAFQMKGGQAQWVRRSPNRVKPLSTANTE